MEEIIKLKELIIQNLQSFAWTDQLKEREDSNY